MKLYITPGSPYARMARIVVLEKALSDRVEVIVAQTRLVDSPYYRINPSGRVPYLVRDDGVGMEESALICDYLDQIDGKPLFKFPPGAAAWEARRLEALARSMLDGIAVWGREMARPENERSAHGRRLGKENRSLVDAGRAQHGANYAELRAGVRGALCGSVLAPRAPEARGLVRPLRVTRVVRCHRAAGQSLIRLGQRVPEPVAIISLPPPLQDTRSAQPVNSIRRRSGARATP
jgi:glutathione S-transferase